MRNPSTLVTAVLAAALAATASAQTRTQPPPGGEEGFFRPARDPALTSMGPPPAPADPQPAPRAARGPATAVVVDVSGDVREAEEDRAEEAAAQARSNAPVITSPLDGTAPILSPLDGSAPIVSPVGR